ncbi:MAG: PucR family transcriptional regulator ligand-binding domain-containing protein [Actinomycetota bacterium]|nr:PucR family transcriptional regulator ligand-binding domain-containing protein [Actinomycetota bacterium]
MPLFLRKLLADPSLGLQLVAGATGLDRRGAVRWAHISEIPDPTPWLEGGELLLTTGLAIASDETLQRRLVAGLDARGCTGVGFGLGVVCDDVPAALADEAERRRLPLFTVPYEVPFLAVTKRVSSEIFDEHYAALRGAVDLQRSVLAAVLADAGAQGVLATVARAMPEVDCVLFDYYGQVLAEHGATDDGVRPASCGPGWEASARAATASTPSWTDATCTPASCGWPTPRRRCWWSWPIAPCTNTSCCCSSRPSRA